MIETPLAPIIYAALAATFFGGQVVLTMQSLDHVDPQTSSMISMGTCVVIFWLLSPLMLHAEYWHNPGMWIFCANGLIHPLFSMYLAFEAVKRMGATVSATISATAPLFAAVGAVFVLGEHLTLALLVGTLGTVLGIMVLSWDRPGATKWALSALVFPIGAAIIRGGNSVVGKFGLELLPSPYFASLISFTISFIGAVTIYHFRIGGMPWNLPRKGLKWSVMAGLCISIGVNCMYSAFHSGLVVVVAPIIATNPLITFLISLIFRQEALNRRVLLGVIFVIGGVIWISLQ